MIKYGRPEMLAHHTAKREEAELKAAEEKAVTQEVQTAIKKRGRPKGSNNFREAKQVMEQYGNPLIVLLKIAHAKDTPTAEKIKAAAAACGFCFPRLSTVKTEAHVDISHEYRAIQVLAATDPAVAEAMESIVLKLATMDRQAVHDATFERGTTLLPEPSAESE